MVEYSTACLRSRIKQQISVDDHNVIWKINIELTYIISYVIIAIFFFHSQLDTLIL